ncbi:YlcI/YnfO family protein [Yersinia enterocolitica]|uniref:YlcI/YnfO family protein n=1 Tax=Yersinia enterocolitica TaxID=630 RepID=UPI001EEFEF0F|nr:YlcI/YnfO family protein [Yersinia enterocolitica]
MSTSSTNNKSQQLNARFPHEVVNDMEASLKAGETKAQFIVTAVRGEIARRQTEGATENPLLSSLDALEQVEAIGITASEEINRLVSVAREELQRRKAKEVPEG